MTYCICDYFRSMLFSPIVTCKRFRLLTLRVKGVNIFQYTVLCYVSIKKWLTDFWWLTVVTISILKGLICGQKYWQQKDYNTSCKSFSIRFWKFAYSISLFTFIVNYKYTSSPLTKQHFMLCEIYTMILTQGWQNQSLGLALDM